MFGPPKDVEGECNARLYLADDWGDNGCTMRCSLPTGHDGEHQESFERSNGNKVLIHWAMDERGTYEDPEHAFDDEDDIQ